MTLIKKYDGVSAKEDILLTKDEALAVFNLLKVGTTVAQIKHKLFLPTKKVKVLETRLIEVREMIEKLVKGESRLVLEESHFEEIDGVTTKVIDVEEVRCPVPSTLSKLKERSVQLIGRDYDISEPLFETDDINTLVTAINYVVEQLVLHSNNTNNDTFSWWKSKVIGG